MGVQATVHLIPNNYPATVYTLFDESAVVELDQFKGIKAARIPVRPLMRNEICRHDDLQVYIDKTIVLKASLFTVRPIFGIRNEVNAVSLTEFNQRFKDISDIILVIQRSVKPYLKGTADWKEYFFKMIISVQAIEAARKTATNTLGNCFYLSGKPSTNGVHPSSPLGVMANPNDSLIFRVRVEVARGSYKRLLLAFDYGQNKMYGRLKNGNLKEVDVWNTEVAIYRKLQALMGQNVDLPGLLLPRTILQYSKSQKTVVQIVVPLMPTNFADIIFNKTLTLAEKRSYFHKVLEAVYTFHSKLRYAHRDIKAGNFLVDKDGKLKLCDYGFAKEHTQETVPNEHRKGTPGFRPPENRKGNLVDYMAWDAWSTGVLLASLMKGEALSLSIMQIANKWQKFDEEVDRINRQPKLDDPYDEIARLLLRKDPKERISVAEAYQRVR